jgi:hypothetical protein
MRPDLLSPGEDMRGTKGSNYVRRWWRQCGCLTRRETSGTTSPGRSGFRSRRCWKQPLRRSLIRWTSWTRGWSRSSLRPARSTLTVGGGANPSLPTVPRSTFWEWLSPVSWSSVRRWTPVTRTLRVVSSPRSTTAGSTSASPMLSLSPASSRASICTDPQNDEEPPTGVGGRVGRTASTGETRWVRGWTV